MCAYAPYVECSFYVAEACLGEHGCVRICSCDCWGSVIPWAAAVHVSPVVLPKACESVGVADAIPPTIIQELPGLLQELNQLREFYDPDTVQLMQWIM